MSRVLRAALVAAFLLIPTAAAQAAPVVVSEFRFRGPDGGNDEFIELRNTSDTARSIAGWTVRGCNSGGTVGIRATIPAGVSLPVGGAYLLVNNNASGPYSGTVPGDLTYGTGITDTGGIRLVDGAGTLQDAVGHSSVVGSAGCREGTGLSNIPTTNGENAFERVGGTQDTDDNVADFQGPKQSDPQNAQGGDDAPSVAGSSPTNGASDVAPGTTIHVAFSEPVTITPSGIALACGGAAQAATTTQDSPTSATVDPDGDLPRGESCTLTIAATAVSDTDAQDPPDEMLNDARITFSTEGLRLRIHEIQGAAHRSPYAGRPVKAVPGVVTAVDGDGFWMQDPNADGDDATSEGIRVFFDDDDHNPAVGTPVTVDGRVQEFRPGGATSANLSTTEIVSPVVEKTGTGEITATLVGPGGRVPPMQIIEDDGSGDVELGGFLFDPAEDGLDFHESLEGMLVSLEDPEIVGPTTSNEELAVLASGVGSPRTARGGILMRPNDLNPERIILDDLVLLARGETIPPANVGDTLAGPIEAVVDYSFGNPKYLVTEVPAVNDNGLEPEVTESPRANQLAMASMNVENLAANDPTLTPAALEAKFARLAGQLVTSLRSPDIVAVEEIQDANGTTNNGNVDAGPTYARFIDAIVAAGGPRYEYRQIDPVNNADGGAPGGNIRVGFLFRTDRGLEFVDRPGGTATNQTDVVATHKGAQLTLSPGRLLDPQDTTTFQASRKPLAGEFLWNGRTVFAIANHFNSKGGDDPLFGRRQPPVAVTEVQRHKQAQVLAGFVEDVLAADPRAAVAVLGDLNDFDFSETLDIVEGAGLNNLMDTLPPAERYSYVFDGNSQVLDQILVSDELMTPAPEYDSVHVNAEFSDQASDHDPQVARVVVRGTGNAK